MAVAPEKANVEVNLGVPVHRIWSASKKIDVLMPLVLPDVFSSCDLDGDGGPGTIRVYHCGPGMPPPSSRVSISLASHRELNILSRLDDQSRAMGYSYGRDRRQFVCDLDQLKAGSAEVCA